ncbi:MAG: DUF2807 domain-containing protein [Verrucomicrobia bacterium]|nr:DUF2807 domain-containing protein [Verrucomicrobiota bacterium]
MIEGSGIASAENRWVEPFDGIDLHLPVEVDIRRGNVQMIHIIADDNVLPLVVTAVAKGTLHILANIQFKPNTPIRIEIETPTISGVVINGSGNVKLDSVTDREVSLIINGSGNITARGAVNTLNAVSNGSGNLLLRHLIAQTGQVATNGSGNAAINVTTTLSNTISGSGNIKCYAVPGTVKSHKAGSGEFIVC